MYKLALPYNWRAMSAPSSLDQIADRIELLLQRHRELQQVNTMLAQQVLTLTQERDSLQSRLRAARARVDTLLDRIPDPALSHQDAP